MKAPPRTQGIIAAGLLAILTVSVFATLTYSGPESALSRFHYGIVSGDLGLVRDSSLQDPKAGPARELLLQVQALIADSQYYHVYRMQRDGRRATVEMVYVTRSYGPVVIPFAMTKPSHRWRVDANATWGLVAQARISPR